MKGGNMRITHVYHTGVNIGYYHKVLKVLNKYKKYDVKVLFISLGDYVKLGINPPADVLSYQTFPDQRNRKFNPNLVRMGDALFHEFKGHKIIVCTHDNGNIDSFARFRNSKKIPRVKCFPTKQFLDNYNVILSFKRGIIQPKSAKQFYDYLKNNV